MIPARFSLPVLLIIFLLSFLHCNTAAAAVAVCPCPFCSAGVPSAHINPAHLNSLKETITTPDGKKLSAWAIYAEPASRLLPADAPFKHVEAPDEGISCVDDVARAAVVYLKMYRQSGDRAYLALAREALDFVMYMETPEGLFYNFIFADGTMNRKGITSRPSLDFWTIRGLWALTEGYGEFRDSDREYAATLKEHLDRILSQLDGRNGPLSRAGTYSTIAGVRMPRWLIGDGTDQAALTLLALARLYEADRDERVKKMSVLCAEGIIAAQGKESDRFPFCSFPSWAPAPMIWHAWGSRQTQALARAGRIYHKEAWVKAAEKEASNFSAHLLASQGLIFGMGPSYIPSPAQPYGAETLTGGLTELYRTTGKEHYAVMAGLSASWLLGNNTSGRPVYEEKTGRVFDGVDGWKRNRNSGAEATISGLLTLTDLYDIGPAHRYIDCRTVQRKSYQVIDLKAMAGRNPGSSIIKTDKIEGALINGGTCVEYMGTRPFTLQFTLAEDNEVIPYLCAAVKGSGAQQVLSYSFDGARDSSRLSIPCDGVFRLMKLARASLKKGFHTMTLTIPVCSKGSSTLFLDTLVVQPLIEHRTLRAHDGSRLIIMKSFSSIPCAASLKMPGEGLIRNITILNNRGASINNDRNVGIPDKIVLPPYGSALIQYGGGL